jgi:SAM-dependent methyltransferase
VVGNDLSTEACQFVRNNFAIEVVNAPLEECQRQVGRFDAIVMNDLVEHVVELESFMSTVNDLLNPGGVVLLWTPNGGAAGKTAETGRDWLGFKVDLEHLQYLSARTILELTRKFGWEIGHIETLGVPDLEGISRISSLNSNDRQGLRELLRNIPGLRKLAWTVRDKLGRRSRKPVVDGPAGNYHLFAILRKELS